MHARKFICKWHNCASVLFISYCYSCLNRNVRQPRCQENFIRVGALHWICFTKHRLRMFLQIWIEKWMITVFCWDAAKILVPVDQYFYEFIMLILFCQPLCPEHLGYHIVIYGLFISFRLYFKKNRVAFLPPPQPHRSHKCNFWFQWIMLL